MPEETVLIQPAPVERATFEAAYKNEMQEIYTAFGEDRFDAKEAFKRNAEDRYECKWVQSAWWAWQARGALDKAAHFTAIDMSTAAAQGFRDGHVTPVVVVLPERRPESASAPNNEMRARLECKNKGYNEALDEVTRLNTK